MFDFCLPGALVERALTGFAAGLLFALPALSQPASIPSAIPAAVSAESSAIDRSAEAWLLRMHQASRKSTYMGTFVVSSGAHMSSSRIWHVCEGDQKIERIEALSGAPRSIFRRNDQVVTFSAHDKVVRFERREELGVFPNLLKANDSSIASFYVARQTGVDRVAGFDADVVQLMPKDPLRYGYRVWTERKTGMAVKLQTLDGHGHVLEQAAFSDLQFNVPVTLSKLEQMMGNTDGYRVEKPELVKTTASDEGWTMAHAVAGFKSMSSYKRPIASDGDVGARTDSRLQWIFSDGLASVSVFVEAYDRMHHRREGTWSMGATQTLTRRLVAPGGDWWLTVMGEVPHRTLLIFAQGLERKK